MLHKMLEGMPTRPVLYIVPVTVVLVLIFYFNNLEQKCTYQASLRTSLEEAVQKNDLGTVLKLADITPFVWEKVKIFSKFKPERKAKTCPFGWDWSADEREFIIASELLTVLIFANKGKLSNYIELRSDLLAFDVVEESFFPETALFSIKKNSVDAQKTLIIANEKLSSFRE